MISRRVSTILFVLTLSVVGVGALLGLLHSGRAQAQVNSITRYVSPGANCGVVTPCYGSVQVAVDSSDNGDIIKVSQGVYTNTGDNVLVITKSLSVLGGFSTVDWGDSSPQKQQSILNGEDERRVVYLSGGGIDKITLSGLTIKNGSTLTGGGSGLLIVSGTVEVANSLITDNDATKGSDNFGGGVAISGSVVALINNAIIDNLAGSGAGLSINGSDVRVIGNEIRGNKAITGGGFHIFGQATLVLNDNRIINNEAKAGRGPGLLLDEAGFIDGINNIVADNGDSQGDGEGINVWAGTINARHWTLANNDAYGLVISNGVVNLVNTIVAGHSIAGLFGDFVEANTTLFFNNKSNCTSGATCSGSLEGDPAFVDPSTYDYHITHDSAAVNAGIDALVRTDIDGDVRPSGEGFDIGVDEISFSYYLPFALNVISTTIGANK